MAGHRDAVAATPATRQARAGAPMTQHSAEFQRQQTRARRVASSEAGHGEGWEISQLRTTNRACLRRRQLFNRPADGKN
jgi:hypothetical protein